ncbi:MAG: hypothetical protein PHF14_01455 [Verrucomicrobiota bacterium]|nr:hypothetical protein [Verrucomicrobiota bacterium]
MSGQTICATAMTTHYLFGGDAPRASASLRRLPDLPVCAVASAYTPAREPGDTAARSAAISDDDLNAPVPMRRIEPTVKAEVTPQPATTEAAKGEKVYNQMSQLLKVSKEKDMVRHAIQTMKKYEPDEFAALMAYFEQRKAEQTQVAMR